MINIPRIKNWNPFQETYNQKKFPNIWINNETGHKVIMRKKKTRSKGIFYNVYAKNPKDIHRWIKMNEPNREKARKYAVKWMKKNPKPGGFL